MRKANVPPGTSPVEAWRRLHQVEGAYATIIDLYALAAGPRGLAPEQLPKDERLALVRMVLPEIWSGFAQTAGSDRGGDVIRVVDYDSDWPGRYQQWHAHLREGLAGVAQRIEHVGSTSVPGLAAKPIIDIQVSVVGLCDESRYVARIESLGLQLRSRDDLHRHFRPVPDDPDVVHVHVCGVGSAWEREHLLFRDYLRAHADACDAYESAKRRAAVTWADDGWAYTAAKSVVILRLLAEAEQWRGSP